MNNFLLQHIELYDHPSQNFWLDKYLKLRKKYKELEEINKKQKVIINYLEEKEKEKENENEKSKDQTLNLN